MLDSITVPVIKIETQIGETMDGTPITIGDISYMTTWKSPYTFNIYDKHTRTVSGPPKPTRGATITDVEFSGDGNWKVLNPCVGTIVKYTMNSEQIDKLVIDYFNKNVWANAKNHCSEKNKWKIFGHFITDYAKKCLGSTLWNHNSLVYWSNVSLTLKV